MQGGGSGVRAQARLGAGWGGEGSKAEVQGSVWSGRKGLREPIQVEGRGLRYGEHVGLVVAGIGQQGAGGVPRRLNRRGTANRQRV